MQDAPRQPAPAISLKFASVDTMGDPWLITEPNPLVFDPLGFTADASADTMTRTAHGLRTGDGPVRVTSTGTLPGGLAVDVNYWVVRISDDVFKLARRFIDAMTGVTIDLTTAGVDIHVLSSTASTVRAGQELSYTALGMYRAIVTLESYSLKGVGQQAALALLQRVRTRTVWPSQRELLRQNGVGYLDATKARWVRGVRDATLFEPRAMMDVHFAFTAREAEFGTIIERAEITNNSVTPGHKFEVDAESPP